MKSKILTTTSIIAIFMLLSSCNSDNDNDNNGSFTLPDSRNIRYELSGNAVGGLDLIYTLANGNDGTGAPSANLPFIKDVVVNDDVKVVSFYSALFGDQSGKTITAKIYVGGVVKIEQTAVTDTNGDAIIPKLSYTLK